VSTFIGLILLLAASGILTCVSLYLGIARLQRAGGAAAGTAGTAPRVRFTLSAEVPGSLRLPRFDLTAVRTASSSQASRLRQETKFADLKFVLSDSARDHLDILAEYSGDGAGSKVLPVTVITAERRTDYLLIFWPETSGHWIARIEAPGVRDWADVFIRDLRERASLTVDDAVTVVRSVRAVPDAGVPAWQAVEHARPEGDAVREAIGRALRSA
jgi:hypothetical protein